MVKRSPTKIDNIRDNLWPMIKDKKGFIIACADEFGRMPSTINSHWFAKFWSVPEALVDKVIAFMQHYIANQEEGPRKGS